MKLLILLTFLVTTSVFAASNVAKVMVFKGEVYAVDQDNKKTMLKRGEWLREGTKVQTSKKSFVRLKFIDKSQMNVGPDSEVKIEKFSKDKAGVISVLKGKLRSKVSKDYLQMEEGKSKLFVKSRNAVMGIRGTDFSFVVGENQAVTAVLYEGSVYFNKMDAGVTDLESIVNKGVAIRPGEFSVINQAMPKPTIPAKMNSRQFNALKKNSDFKRGPSNNGKNAKAGKGVPPGLTAGKVANEHKELTKNVAEVTKVSEVKTNTGDSKQAIGFIKDGSIKPTDGSAVDIETGKVIAPRSDAQFDANTGEYDDARLSVKDDGSVEVLEKNDNTNNNTGKKSTPIPSSKPAVILGPEVPSGDKPDANGIPGTAGPLGPNGPVPSADGLPKEDAPPEQPRFADPGSGCSATGTCPPPSDPTNPNAGVTAPVNNRPTSRVRANPTNGN